MKHLYAPWRTGYLAGQKSERCPFCLDEASPEYDTSKFIIRRYTHCFLLLNVYPYNAGHCMIIPFKHVATLDQLTIEARTEIMEVVSAAVPCMEKALQNVGFNIGINLGGAAAGGSIPEHVHVHVVPRWPGDTNFLLTVADTKQISFDLHEVYKKLVVAFTK